MMSAALSKLLPVLLLLFPSVTLFAPLFVAPALGLTVIGLMIWQRRCPVQALPRVIWIPLLALLGWALVTTFWSLSAHSFALRVWLMTSATITAGICLWGIARSLTLAQRQRVCQGLFRGLQLAAGILLCLGVVYRISRMNGGAWEDALQAHFLFGRLTAMDRGATVLALWFWPLALALWPQTKQRQTVLLTGLLLGIGEILSLSLSAKLAFLTGAGLTGGFFLFGRLPVRLLVAGGLSALLLGMPVAGALLPPPEVTITWPGMPFSAHHRLTIWSYTANHITEHPVRGWGLESAREIAQNAEIIVVRPSDGDWRPEALLPLHPHNGALHIWFDLGGIGALLTLALLVGGILRLRPASPHRELAGLLLLAGGGLVFMVSYGIWQSWWQATLLYTLAFGEWIADPGKPQDSAGSCRKEA